MPAFCAKPPLVRPAFGHKILRGQTCWVVAGQDRNSTPADPLIRGLAARTLGAGVTYGDSGYGAGYQCNGSSTGYVDLGSTNRFLPSENTPFTVAWIERYTGAGTEAGVLGIFPTGATKQFMMLRISHDGIAPTQYGRFACGPWTTSGILPSFLGPPKLNESVGITRAFLLTGANGTISQSPTAYVLYCDGARYTSDQGGNTGNLGATANYFGWDNADSKWTGTLDNLRIWSRVLGNDEIVAYFRDPYVGGRPNTDVTPLYAITSGLPAYIAHQFELAA